MGGGDIDATSIAPVLLASVSHSHNETSSKRKWRVLFVYLDQNRVLAKLNYKQSNDSRKMMRCERNYLEVEVEATESSLWCILPLAIRSGISTASHGANYENKKTIVIN